MNEIGVFLNEKELISSFEEARYVKIFANLMLEYMDLVKMIILV